jgi:uncharacterized protein (TIGR01777 family)
MKIVIPGGTGQVGTILARAFIRDGHDVTVISRSPATMGPWRVVTWDAVSMGDWAAELEGADAVINLSGRSVNCRCTAHNRNLIMDSRLNSTRVIGEAIARCNRPPRVWLQASTATIYAHRYDQPNDEASGVLDGSEPNAPDTWKFSVAVATSWERTINEVRLAHTRKVLLRTAIVFSPDRGGAFNILLRLVRLGLGGRSGDGLQYVSWIHEVDFVRAVYWLIEHELVDGPVNLAAPNPVPNEEFMRTLREAWGIRVGLPATKLMLEIGALLVRTETELLLKSRRVVPGILTKHGFVFQFPTWREAARDLCRRWRELNGAAKARAQTTAQ